MPGTCDKPVDEAANWSGLMPALPEAKEWSDGRPISLEGGLFLMGRRSPMAMDQLSRMRLRAMV